MLWTPSVSPTLTALENSKELFPNDYRLRRLNLIVEAVGDTLLTKEAFSEMIQFEKILYSVSEFADTNLNDFRQIERRAEGKVFKFSDVCP